MFSRKGDCPTCKGTGRLPQYWHIDYGRCRQCKGTGGTKPPEGHYWVLLHGEPVGMIHSFGKPRRWYWDLDTENGSQGHTSRREAACALLLRRAQVSAASD